MAIVLMVSSMAAMGLGTAETSCEDVHETFSATVTGVPDEFATGTSVEADEYDLTLGSADCRISTLTAATSASGTVSDFDLDVDFEGITVEHSATASGDERVDLQGPPTGEYTIRVKPWSTVDASYTLTIDAELEPVESASGPNKDDEFVVVAVVDSGINPYHTEFLGSHYPTNTDSDTGNDVDFNEHPSNYIEGYPEEAVTKNLTLSLDTSYSDSVSQDDWDAVDDKKLYWLNGTKIIGAYDGDGAFDGDTSILDEDGHGTASAAVAAGNSVGACERCLIIAVEGTGGIDWAMSQPWIDFVSNSWGTIGNVGAPTAGNNDVDPLAFGNERAQESRVAVQRGQTVLFAAGNGMVNAFATPETTYTSPYTGPDWVMTVGATWKHGGSDYCECSGDESVILASGKPVDVSSSALGDIPAAPHDSKTDSDQHSGTSAATPQVSGIMGETLLHAREILGDTTGGNHDGIIAQGEPNGSGMLDDGLFSRAELETAVKYTAQHTHSAWIGIYPVSPPTSPVPQDKLWTQWAVEGWGHVTDRTGVNATAVVNGTMSLPDRPMDERFASVDEDNRAVLWGTPVEPSH